jgi:hypothetical protein
MLDNGVRLDTAQIDLPIANATATVEGLTVDLRNRSYGWDMITLKQAAPIGNEAVTVSNLEATIQGKDARFTTDASTRIDIHPNENVQAGATVGVSYDGLTGQASLSVADGAVQVVAGPATVAANGVSVQDGVVAVDAAQVVLPEAGVGFRVDGYTFSNGQSDWTGLTWYGQELKLGEVATLSDMLVVVPGPSTAGTAPMGAATSFSVQAGNVATADGQVVFTYDSTTGEPTLMLRNANAQFGVPAWNVAFNGITTGKQGSTVDSIVVTAAPIGVQAGVDGLAVTPEAGMSFDQAWLLYQPAQPTGEEAIAGFRLVVDSTEGGYIVSTTTLVPSNKGQ